jgi:membrane associated rhomboid family serine protease
MTKLSKPYFTYIIAIFCIVWYALLLISVKFGPIPNHLFEKFGAPFASDIFDGQFWGLITNSFVHKYWWHLALNLLFLWVFGRIAEREYGSKFFVLYGLVASFITSSTQLAMSGDAGIGFTGVNFAYMTFLLSDSKKHWKSAWVSKICWTLCIVTLLFVFLNFYFVWFSIGFSAIASGFIFGALYGALHKVKSFRFAFTATTVAICTISLLYNPFSSEWNTYKGFKVYSTGNLDKAERHYKKAVELSPKNVIAAKNLELIKIDRLANKAYQAHSNEKYSIARKYYLKILALDNRNYWAKQNLKELP